MSSAKATDAGAAVGPAGVVYADYQSSKPVDPRVVEAMLPYFTQNFGNAASLHGVGDAATAALEEARARVARFIGAEPAEIVFTSGATEANNLALIGYAMRNRRKGDHIIITEAEHISILNIAKYLEKNGFRITRLPIDLYGRVSPKKLRARITDETILVSVGWASNEIGTIQPIAEIAETLAGTGIVFHSDAVAAEGLVPIDVRETPVGMLSLSSNDIYGPRGLGVLYLRKGVALAPVLLGGGQERGLRSGTEDVASIAGMAAAADIMAAETPAETARIKAIRDRLVARVLAEIPDAHLNGAPLDHPGGRLPNNAHFRFAAVEGEAMVLSLRDAAIAASTGSACSSKTLEPSHTLISCGLLHEEAHGSLEFTFGRFSKEEDVDRIMAALPGVVARLRELSPLYQKPPAGKALGGGKGPA
ncbi:MAG TPA: cysteine desulfurase family protein [Thermoleophilia bacterium]|nr:cysteine desulfurase family protein [Thermoleophilia bacterium]HQJ98496.1 cysteine desulfurase family protein [Thermoleophilia bacterium]